VKLPLGQPDPLTPPAGLRDLQLRGSVHPVITAVGDPGWLVTGRAEVLTWLDDDRLGRSHPDPARAARTGESVLFGGPSGAFDTEKADHKRLRDLLQPHFTPARMRALRPRVQQLTGELLNNMAAGDRPCDLVQAVAVPLPVLMICELLGVPVSDRDRFRAWTRDAANVADRRQSMAGLGALFGYGQQLVAAKQDQPADDVISRLAATPRVGAPEAAQLSMFLLFAGHETTVDQIGKGALQLITAAGQWIALARDPNRVPAAVEEILRTTGKGGGGIPRYAYQNVQIGGVDIAAGELVIFDLGAANHDPAGFAEPDRFNPDRDNHRHLAFGHGLRYCIGAP
jgi:cytochrome P450